MKKELRITVILYSFVTLTAIATLGLKQMKNTAKLISPIGKSYSVLATTSSRKEKEHVVYGFLPYWTIFKHEHFQLDKLTDLAYFALRINANGTIRTIDHEGLIDSGYNMWKNSEELDKVIKEAKIQGVRVALTIISHEDAVTYEFLDCRSCWDTLYNEIETELLFKGISHLNMDFELVEADAKEGFALKYSQLVNFLNTSLDRKFGNSYVVTSTLPDSAYRDRITDISSLSKASDGLFVMAYDFHRPTSDTAGPVAPINGKGIHSDYDIASMLEDYLTQAPSDKLILGVPYYGYNWLVTSGEDYAERIPGTDVLGYSISQTYEDIAETRLEHNPPISWDEHGLVPYFTYYNSDYGTTRQVYFENEKSLKIKYDLAKINNLAGIGIWALGYDGGFQELWQLLDQEFGNVK